MFLRLTEGSRTCACTRREGSAHKRQMRVDGLQSGCGCYPLRPIMASCARLTVHLLLFDGLPYSPSLQALQDLLGIAHSLPQFAFGRFIQKLGHCINRLEAEATTSEPKGFTLTKRFREALQRCRGCWGVLPLEHRLKRSAAFLQVHKLNGPHAISAVKVYGASLVFQSALCIACRRRKAHEQTHDDAAKWFRTSLETSLKDLSVVAGTLSAPSFFFYDRPHAPPLSGTEKQ